MTAEEKRYIIIGNTRKGWSIIDTLPAGMKTLEDSIPRKWVAQQRCDDLNRAWEKKNKNF